MDLHLSISNGFVSSKIYEQRDDFDFDILNFPFLDGDVPRRPSYGVYISQLIRFARVCSHVDDFNTRNKCLTAKLLIHFSWLGPDLSSVAWSTGAQLIIFFCFRFSVVLFDRPGISIRNATDCICRVVLVFASS